jgi:hypothetical protein
MLAGIIMLQHNDGWKYLAGIMANSEREFLLRHAALRTVRFIHDYRPDLVQEKDLVTGLAALLEQSDIADMAIEDLRKWQRWEMLDKVLDLFDRKSHNFSVIKRAVLRFALCAPAKDYPKAAEFVAKMRKQDPEWVTEVEDLLSLDGLAKPATGTSPTLPKKPLTK